MSLEEVYQEIVLEHYREPRCAGKISNPDCSACLLNPLCGDKIELNMRVEHECLSELKFEGKGCAISQACASMMSELCSGRSISDAERLRSTFHEMLLGEQLPANVSDLGDAALLAGVKKLPSRQRCALLAWEALDRCIAQWRAKQQQQRVA